MPQAGENPAPPAQPGASRRLAGALRPWLVQALLPLTAGALLLGVLLALGRRARDDLRAHGRYAVPFADVACAPPPGLARTEFLGEVQYLAGLPDTLDLLDPALLPRLEKAFAAHPWVAAVQGIERTPGGLRVSLTYRAPVLAVRLPGPGKGRREVRAVDVSGVLLPRTVEQGRLPLLVSAVAPPAGPPGRGWGEPKVTAAAAVAAYLGPYLERLGLAGCAVEVEKGEVTLSTPQTRISWGHAPGEERPGEASAAVKLRRLLDSRQRPGNR
jgi:hypothetical protein